MVAPSLLECARLQHPQERDLRFSFGGSPISFRKRVPRSAASNLAQSPLQSACEDLCRTRKTRAQLATTESGNLRQIKALIARTDLQCSARAISCFPLPVSPRIMTAKSNDATVSSPASTTARWL